MSVKYITVYAPLFQADEPAKLQGSSVFRFLDQIGQEVSVLLQGFCEKSIPFCRHPHLELAKSKHHWSVNVWEQRISWVPLRPSYYTVPLCLLSCPLSLVACVVCLMLMKLVQCDLNDSLHILPKVYFKILFYNFVWHLKLLLKLFVFF